MLEEDIAVEAEDTQDIVQVARFFSEVLNFLRKNAKDEAIACMVLTGTSAGNFWMNGMVHSRIWENGVLETAITVQRGRMFHHIAANAVKIQETVAEAKLRAVPVKGKAQ